MLGAGIEALRLKRYRDQFAARASERASRAVLDRNAEKSSRELAAQYESLRATKQLLLDMSPKERPLLAIIYDDIDKRVVELSKCSEARSETQKLHSAEARYETAKFAYYALCHDSLIFLPCYRVPGAYRRGPFI
jgi:hypothetical protein